jgi:protein TonB
MKKYTIIILILLQPLLTLGQDTTYMANDWTEVGSLEQALFIKVVTHDSVEANRATATFYFKSGQVRSIKKYSNYKNLTLDGKLQKWYENGQLHQDIDYKNGKKNGQLLTYWDNGNPKRIDFYEDDELIEGKCLNVDGIEVPHYEYKKMPEFSGGINGLMQYLAEKIKYPNKAQKNGVEGRVLVFFTVNENGAISDIRIEEGVSDEIDKEVIRLVKKMPKWDPGVEDGDPVKVALSLPVIFKLE